MGAENDFWLWLALEFLLHHGFSDKYTVVCQNADISIGGYVFEKGFGHTCIWRAEERRTRRVSHSVYHFPACDTSTCVTCVSYVSRITS